MGWAVLGCSDNQAEGSRLKPHTILHHVFFLLQINCVLVSNFETRLWIAYFNGVELLSCIPRLAL